MKAFLCRVVPALSLVLCSCGPGPEPEALLGEADAPAVVSAFLSAVQEGNDSKAESLSASNPDRIVGNLDNFRELFFERQATGKRVLRVGREVYAREWHIFVDLQITYGSQMKQAHFILVPGEPPQVRGVSPILPD